LEGYVEVDLRCWSVCLGFVIGHLAVVVVRKLLKAVHSSWLLSVQLARFVAHPLDKVILAVSSDVMLVVGWVETLYFVRSIERIES
jgi:hypothetical protein